MQKLDFNKEVQEIYNNYDNLEVLEIVKYFLVGVVASIDRINKENIDVAQDYLIDYDLGNNYYIMEEDLESIVSIIDTISDVLKYNENIRKENYKD